MRTSPIADETLVLRLPLPLAQLLRAACNAKTPLDRHQAAFYIWEVALKVIGSVAIIEYADWPDHDPRLADLYHNLTKPTLGQWWELVRELVPALAEREVPGFMALRRNLLELKHQDLPRCAALDGALLEACQGTKSTRSTVKLADVFARLVEYRNKFIGHGPLGMGPKDFYERLGQLLLAAAAEFLGRFDGLAGRKLLYVSEIKGMPTGRWEVSCFELIGETSRRLMEPLEFSAEETRLPRAHGVYLAVPRRDSSVRWKGDSVYLRLLRPLVLFREDTDEVFFLNGHKDGTRTEYLCYVSGTALKQEAVGDELRSLLAQVQGNPAAAAPSPLPEPIIATEASTTSNMVGEFQLISKIGEGGMGKVYRALQPSLGRQVALKKMKKPGDARAEARFLREINSLGRVEHPNLVKVYTSGLEEDGWYYAMELIEGADLGAISQHLTHEASPELGPGEWRHAITTASQEARTREESVEKLKGKSRTPVPGSATATPLPSELALPTAAHVLPPMGTALIVQIVELIRQVALAAHALHEAHVIHRDIKPGNILVTQDGDQAVLMDLGLARLEDAGGSPLTDTRQFIGTLRYASPEQVKAFGPVDRRSDIYSLGVTLWEMLTLRPFLDITDQTPTPAMMTRITDVDPERPRKYNPRSPRTWRRLSASAWRKTRRAAIPRRQTWPPISSCGCKTNRFTRNRRLCGTCFVSTFGDTGSVWGPVLPSWSHFWQVWPLSLPAWPRCTFRTPLTKRKSAKNLPTRRN